MMKKTNKVDEKALLKNEISKLKKENKKAIEKLAKSKVQISELKKELKKTTLRK